MGRDQTVLPDAPKAKDLMERLAPQELLKRTALETQKLELITELSGLKLKLSGVGRDHRDTEVDSLPVKLSLLCFIWS